MKPKNQCIERLSDYQKATWIPSVCLWIFLIAVLIFGTYHLIKGVDEALEYDLNALVYK